ncbi:MAG TPA: hypothetical protein PLF40_31470 [Kofleriaceae bacterium]|nr:hypothetical protein [Kofleriaceae bacterium]
MNATQPTLSVTTIVWLVTKERTLAGKPPLQCRVEELRTTHGRVYHARLQPLTGPSRWAIPADICKSESRALFRAKAIIDEAHDALSRRYADGHTALLEARKALGLLE